MSHRTNLLAGGAAAACVLATGMLLGAPVITAAAGAWSIAASADSGASDDHLNAVACAAAGDCWAVGSYFDGSGYRTLIEHGTDGAWQIVASPNGSSMTITNPSQDNELTGVACVTGDDCWAAGYYYNGSNYAQTLIEHYDGSAWSIVSSPNSQSVQDNLLNAITCVDASHCVAVGYYLTPGVEPPFVPGTPDQTLVVQYDGTSWTLAKSPNRSTAENALYGVACASADTCSAVGIDFNGSSYESLVEQLNAGTWSIDASENPSASENLLDGAACTGGDCTAAGLIRGSAATQTLIEHEGAGGWSAVTSADTSSTQLNDLTSIACAGRGDCWAAGGFLAGADFSSGHFQTLIEHGGSGWTVVPSPNTDSAHDNYLAGIACASSADCVAVGYFVDGGGNKRTLVEQYGTGLPAAVPDLGVPPLAAGAALLGAALVRMRRSRRAVPR